MMKNLPAFCYQEFLKKASYYSDVCLPDPSEVIKSVLPGPYSLNLYPKVIYLLDYVHCKYLLIIPSGNLVFGYTVNYIIDAGPLNIFSFLHPHDFDIVNEKVFPANVLHFREADLSRNTDMAFTCTYRIRNKSGGYSFIQQRSCYLVKSADGIPLATLGTMVDISHLKTESRIVHIIEDMGKAYAGSIPSIVNFYYPDESGNTLSRREIDVLKWVCEGLSSKQIADKLHISIHTINNHRKNMLEKTNCKNVSELLNHAVRTGLV